MHLNEVEQDFIDFFSKRYSKDPAYVTQVYQKTKQKFSFSTPEFRALTVDVYDLNKLLHDEVTEAELVDTYKYHELMTTLRFLSYSFEYKKESDTVSKLKTAAKLLITGEFRIFTQTLLKKNKITKELQAGGIAIEPVGDEALADFLIKKSKVNITTIVDYGCGPAYLSFAIAKLLRKQNGEAPVTYLVDVDCLSRGFATYRFQKNNLPCEVITVSKEILYPALPEHQLCIATEVMEHVKQPIAVFTNINATLSGGGILHGNYEDHTPHMLHVSPDLSQLREALKDNNYTRLSRLTYLKN